MPLPIIAIARTLPGKLEIPGAEIRTANNDQVGALSRDELLRFVRGATIIVTWVSEKVDAAVLDAAGPSLKAVCNFAVGTDNIDLAACRDRRIVVTNTPNAVTEGTADLAWAYLAGREQGLQSYCDLRNAPQVGLRGESYEGVCPPDVDPEYRRRHRIGFDIYSFNAEIGRLQNRYDALEERLRRNRREFDKRLGLHDKKDDPQRLYRDFEREQARIRDEQRSILNALQWNQYQSRNAAALLEQLR